MAPPERGGHASPPVPPNLTFDSTMTMSALDALRRVGVPLLAGALVTAIMAITTLLVVEAQEQRHAAQVRTELVREGSRLRAGLERSVESLVARTEGLVGFATAEGSHGDVDGELFQTFARQLDEDRASPFRRLQLAPAGVVTFVYPPGDAAQVVGDEPLADPERRDAVQAAITARRTLISGPVEIPQGGVMLIARAPVFVPTADGGDRFWGLATTIADAGLVYEQAGLRPAPDGTSLALRGQDGSGAAGAVFLGDEAIFAADPVLFDVALPAGSWQLALVPSGGWDAVTWSGRLLALTGGFLLSLVLGGMVWAVMANRGAARAALADRIELIEAANSPIVQVTSGGRVSVWNSRAEELSGVASEDIVGTELPGWGSEVAAPVGGSDLAAVVGRLLTETLETAERIEGRVMVVDRPGRSPAVLMFNTSPVVADRGRITDMVAIAQDITARHEAERVQRENEAMAEAARLKDEFLANTSHELRTPLNGIIGLSSLLASGAAGDVTSTQAEYLQHVQDAGSRLLARINDILDMARAASREAADDVIEEVDVESAAAAAVERVQPVAEHKRLPINVEIPTDAAVVVADHERLVQVLSHLLSNAVKFTKDGQVDVRARRVDGEVQIEVADTGIGIPEDKRHLLFRPFMQVEASLDRPFDGSGLGLALAQRLVTDMGGRIEVASDLGRGSVFTVVLAAADADPATVSRRLALPVGGRRILVVEDDPGARARLVSHLSSRGFEVHAAADGLDAVEVARRVHPDAALVDLALPRREGPRTAGIIKAHRETWQTIVVAMSDEPVRNAPEWLDAGCDAYVATPVDLDEVDRVLDALLEEFGRAPSPGRRTGHSRVG